MKRTLLAAVLIWGLTSGLVSAQPPGAPTGGPVPAHDAAKDGRQAPLSSVLKMIAKDHPGKQLNTTMGQSGGRAVYLVQWQLANGQIKVFTVDAQTGGLLSQ